MDKPTIIKPHRVGRPKRGTEIDRENALIDAATRVFLGSGYVSSSIQKVALEAGISTRTIYERFANKGDLLGAVVSRLVDKDLTTALSGVELNGLEVDEALLKIGRALTARLLSPTVSALIRLLANEGRSFPSLAAKMKERTKDRLDSAIEQYLRVQVAKGTLRLTDPARAATLFSQMINGEFKDGILFGSSSEPTQRELNDHVVFAVDVFLHGTRKPPLRRKKRT